MFIKLRFLWLLVMIAMFVPSAILSHTNAIGQKRKPGSQEPIVEASGSESIDAKRQAKGRRYDRPKSGPIIELRPDEEVLPVNAAWWKGLPALPVAESDAIVVGDVLDGKAHLSTGRTAVYSEFQVRIADTLKNSGPTVLTAGELIIAERLGGSVKFSSGKIQHYRVAKQGLLQTNERYIFFLKRNGEDYEIITGYWINDGQVSPLDGCGVDGCGELQFSTYDRKNIDAFLSELRTAINTSRTKEAEPK